MNETYFGLGIACIVAAIVGGGTKLFGYEIPVVDSLRRQLLLAGFGLALAGSASFSVWGPPLQRLVIRPAPVGPKPGPAVPNGPAPVSEFVGNWTQPSEDYIVAATAIDDGAGGWCILETPLRYRLTISAVNPDGFIEGSVTTENHTIARVAPKTDGNPISPDRIYNIPLPNGCNVAAFLQVMPWMARGDMKKTTDLTGKLDPKNPRHASIAHGDERCIMGGGVCPGWDKPEDKPDPQEMILLSHDRMTVNELTHFREK